MTHSEEILVDINIPVTLDVLVERYSAPEYSGARVELWTFDGPERRAAAQQSLRDKGVDAYVRSSYKPLVHAFLEELDLTGVTDIVVHYPVVPCVHKNRFRLECYPVGELIGERNLTFVPCFTSNTDGLLSYGIDFVKTGTTSLIKQRIEVAAPNRFVEASSGQKVLNNTGWCRVTASTPSELFCNNMHPADQEQAFHAVISALKKHAWPAKAPYFKRMNVRIEAPFYDLRLPLKTEFISTAEAMHEDIYFSALEVFKQREGFDNIDRSFQPGQIVPEIVTNNAQIRVRITICDDPLDPTLVDTPSNAPLLNLETAEHWLEPITIKSHLDALGGTAYQSLSQRGRPVWGTHIEGKHPSVVITAGQHANETSGPVGALRAAEQLKKIGQTDFTVSPLDNPDGYALFRELCAKHPNHMHHASRYTAGGGDLEFLDHTFENKIRHIGQQKTNSDIHLSLHGYPAHEWTRPFSGYIPNGFDMWTIPKGFFLILRHKAGWKERGNIVLDAIISELSTYEPIVSLNRAQLARYKRYVSEFDFEIRNNFPIFTSEVDEGLFPITIITEAPDETIYGEDFIVAHTAQMKSVLGAVNALAKPPLALLPNKV